MQLMATANTSLALKACQMQITPPPEMRVAPAPLNSAPDATRDKHQGKSFFFF